jgi:hypothetical protein
MTDETGRSMLDVLNEFIANDPVLSKAFGGGGGGTPSYRFWRLKKGVAGNRYERWYAYGTERSLGPNGRKPAGWWSWVWVWRKGGRVGEIEQAVRSATRKKAKARAYRLYAQARGWEDTEYEPPRKIVKLPPPPPAPKACERCGRETGALTWTRAVPLWLCETCRNVAPAPRDTVDTTHPGEL